MYVAVIASVRRARANPLNATHRPRHLLSGLLECGVCGGAYVKRGQDRYACSNHARTDGCTNRRGIRRAVLEERVLAGLKHRLMAPEAAEEAIRAYAEKTNRLNRERRASAAGDRRELAAIEKKIATMIAAIEDGGYVRGMSDRLRELEARQVELAERLAAAPADLPDIHPNVAEIYRRKVARLADALKHPEDRDEAATAIRGLIERIVLIPGEKWGEVHATLHGDLGTILEWTAEGDGKNQGGTSPPGLSVSAETGTRFGVYFAQSRNGAPGNPAPLFRARTPIANGVPPMVQPPVGHLERVATTSVWKSEASEFLPWLAKPENLRRFGEALGLNLEPVARETPVGQFRADLLCVDRDTGAKVVIEAQLGTSDHRHLGQVLAYARALRARAVVWLAARFYAEHREVLAELNESDDFPRSCFAVEMAMLKIGASPAAPQYTVVVEPREWPFAICERPGDGTAGAEAAPAGPMEDSPLRARRKRAGMTMAQLAEAVGISSGYLSHIELGKKPGAPETRAALARVLTAADEAGRSGATAAGGEGAA